MTTQAQNGEKKNGNVSSAMVVHPKQVQLKAQLGLMKSSLAEVLPKHLTPERITKVVLSATQRTPALLDCTMTSICESVMQGAELGLEIGGLLGEAYLVPFQKKWQENGRWQSELRAQCIIGYQGLLKLARQSGEVASIVARVVRESEMGRVKLNLATNEVDHPFSFANVLPPDKDPLVGVYAFAVLASGEHVLEPMTKAQVDLIRARSKAGASASSPWTTDYEAMALKTVIRRICKMLPKSAEKASKLKEVVELEEAIETEGELVAEPKVTQGSRLADTIMSKAAAMSPDAPPPPPSQPDREPGSDDVDIGEEDKAEASRQERGGT
jgi:recombination protein RecT